MNELDLLSYVLAFLAPPLIVILWQSILMRLMPMRSGQLVTMASMVFGYPVFFLLVHFLPFQFTQGFVFFTYMFFLYSFSAYSYFHVFNMSETSRRVRLAQAVAQGQQLDLKENLYDERQMIQARLDRLVSLGQMTESRGRYMTRGRLFVVTAIVFYSLGRLFNRPWAPMKKFIEGL